MNYIILEACDEMLYAEAESTVAVYEALSREYDKYMMILENASPSFIQESDIMDKATGKGKLEGTMKKIIMFIPRLFNAIINAITDAFSKKSNETTEIEANELDQYINGADAEELKNLATATVQATDGNVRFDPNKKEFKLGKQASIIWNRIWMIASTVKVFNRIKKEIDTPNSPYKTFAGELKDILKGKKEVDEVTVSLTANAMKNGLFDISSGCLALKTISKELSYRLEKKCKAEYEKGMDTQKTYEMKLLMDEISNTSKQVYKFTWLGKILNALFSDVSFSKKGKIKSKSGIERGLNVLTKDMIHRDKIREIDETNSGAIAAAAEVRGNNTSRKIDNELQDELDESRDIRDDFEDETVSSLKRRRKSEKKNDIKNEKYEKRRSFRLPFLKNKKEALNA